MAVLSLLFLMLLCAADLSRGNEDVCHLPIEVGPCRSVIRVWGYNPKTNQCVNFAYSGCGGNANRFYHRSSCERVCVKPSRSKGY